MGLLVVYNQQSLVARLAVMGLSIAKHMSR